MELKHAEPKTKHAEPLEKRNGFTDPALEKRIGQMVTSPGEGRHE